MTAGGAASESLHLEIVSDPAALASTRKAVEAFAIQFGFDRDAWCEIGLVVNEALANVMRHAYGSKNDQPIHIDAAYENDRIHIRIRDWGNGIDPSKIPCRKPDPRRPGGVGMICLRELMDTFEFAPQADGMLLVMTRSRVRATQAPSVA